MKNLKYYFGIEVTKYRVSLIRESNSTILWAIQQSIIKFNLKDGKLSSMSMDIEYFKLCQ